MSEARLENLTVGVGDGARQIAIMARPGGQPGLFWLGGFASDMSRHQGGGARCLRRDGAAWP